MNRTGGRAAGWASHRIAYRSIVYSVDHVCGAALGISGSLAPGCKTKSNPAAGSRNRQTNDRAPTGRRRVEDRRPADRAWEGRATWSPRPPTRAVAPCVHVRRCRRVPVVAS